MKIIKRYTFLGCVIIFIGLEIFYSKDGGYVHFGYVTPYGGLIFVIIGVLFVYFSIFHGQKRIYDKNVKCIECGQLSYSYDLKDLKCPKCGGEVDNLKGFYKRNPAFKD
ncbi:MAG: hypothetical protein KAR45_02175 [Desulfobacteraceae bacterium]|nr:hypothetical protein [Desulfobacteraceae bacterium]